MDWKSHQILCRFQHGTVKGAVKWMVELPNIVCGLVGMGAYAKTASEGGTYHPVCIWLTFKTGVPGCLRVGKVGSKVSLKWLSMQGYAIGPSRLGSLGLGVRQVKTGTQTDIQGHSVCFALQHKSTFPGTSPPNKTPTLAAITGKTAVIPIQDSKESTCSPAASSSAMAPSSGGCSMPSTSIDSSPRGNKGRPSWSGSSSDPTKPASPLLPTGHSGEAGPAPAPPLSLHPACTKRPPPPPSSSSVALALTTEGHL